MPPPNEPPKEEPPPKKKRGNPATLAKGLTSNQERGTDGKIRKKPAAPVEGVQGEAAGVKRRLLALVEDELVAMEWVWNNPDDKTFQHASFRAMKVTSSIGYYDRMTAMKVERAKAAPKPVEDGKPAWDGVGPCPCCGREVEQPLEDEGSTKIIKMLDQLDAREAAG